MANEKIETSFQSEMSDCCENVPPPSLFGETCPATPPPNQVVKGKPRLSGLQSALTPILKYLNIGNKCSALSPLPDGPTKPKPVENCKDSYACSVLNENLPEITLLDETCNSTMNMTNAQCDNEPKTPFSFKEPKKPMRVFDMNLNSMTPFKWIHDEILPEITLLDETSDGSILATPFCKTSMPKDSPEQSKPNSTLTPEKSSLISGSEASTLETTQNCIPQSKTSKLETTQSFIEQKPTSFSGNLTHSINSGCSVSVGMDEDDVPKIQLQVNSTLTPKKTSLVSGSEASMLETTHDCTPQSKTSKLETTQSATSFSGNLTHSINSGCGVSAGMDEDDPKIQLQVNSTLTPKKTSLVSGSEASTLETTRDCTPRKMPSLDSSEMCSKASKLETTQSFQDLKPTPFSGNLTHSINSGCGVSVGMDEDFPKVQLQATQDISMSSTLDGSKSSSESCAPTLNKTHTVTEAQQANRTFDFNVSNASAQCEAPQASGHSNNVTRELSENIKASTSDSSSKSNPNATVSLSNTFTTVQDNAPAQSSIVHNQTVDLSTSKGSPPMPDNQNVNVSTKQITPDSSLGIDDNSSDSKSSQTCEVQNQTFEKKPLKKSSDSVTSNSLQSKPNGTITYDEKTTVSYKLQDTQDRLTPCPVKNETSAELDVPEKSQISVGSEGKAAEPREGTFNVNTATEINSSSGEVKESNSGHPLLSESIIGHNTDSHKANIFILDSTLDFKTDPLVTSTPMATNKSFSFTGERQDRATATQKKLYGEGPSKPSALPSSEVPSNIVCDRRTFFSQPATKQNMKTLKPPSLLSKFKPVSLLPKRPDLVTSGQAMTRQIEAPKTKPTEKPVSYNLRSTAAASAALKPPVTGLRKGAACASSSGLPRPGLGLKPPHVKASAAASSAADKPADGTNRPALTAKKHPLPKSDALPAAKKKKMDNPPSSSKVEAPASSSDTNSKLRMLKPPTQSQKTLPAKHDSSVPHPTLNSTGVESACRVRTLRPPATGLKAPSAKPQCQNCANCMSLEAQLKLKNEEITLKDEEIKHLKEELQKCKKEDTTLDSGKKY